MKKARLLHYFLLLGLCIAFTNCNDDEAPPPSAKPNLTWFDELDYTPNAQTIFLNDFGISDSVSLISSSAFTVDRSMINDDSGLIDVDYKVDNTIKPMDFNPNAGSYGFLIKDSVAFQQDKPGPPLSPSTRANVTFGPIRSLPCGMYQQTLKIDSENTIGESNEGDNEADYYFHIPGRQRFAITKTDIVNTLQHDAGRTRVTDFRVIALAESVVVSQFTYTAEDGSTAEIVPAPPFSVQAGTPQLIQMWVTPKFHDNNSGADPTLKGELTLISSDGCVIKQESDVVLVEHSN